MVEAKVLEVKDAASTFCFDAKTGQIRMDKNDEDRRRDFQSTAKDIAFRLVRCTSLEYILTW
jgi:hypothetical protein